MMYWGYNGGWMIGGMIFMVIFWAAIIWLIVWGIRRATHHHYSSTSMGDTTPLEIAKTRYAKGEITREQLEEIKKNL
jgi:putative membrane protein